MPDKVPPVFRWGGANFAEKIAIATELLSGLGTRFRQETIDEILTELSSTKISDEKSRLTDWAGILPSTANTEYLKARLSEAGGNAGATIAHWERFLSLTPERDVSVLLSYGTALSKQQRFDEAAAVLRRALLPVPRYSYFSRSAKLTRQVAERPHTSLRTVRIAVLSPSTTKLLVPLLGALCFRDRIRTEIYEGLYGSVDQEILDPESGLSRFRPDVVMLMNHWRSANLQAVADDGERVAEEILEGHCERWRQLRERFGCHVVQQDLDFPAQESYGYLASSLPGGRARITELVNLGLRQRAPAGVSILETPSIQREVGLSLWEDELQWNHWQQHPSTAGLPALTDSMVAHVRAVLGLTSRPADTLRHKLQNYSRTQAAGAADFICPIAWVTTD